MHLKNNQMTKSDAEMNLQLVNVNIHNICTSCRSQTCNCRKGSDWLKRWVEAQHNIFKL